MMWFRKREKPKTPAIHEAEVEAIKEQTYEKVNKATEDAAELVKVLKRNGITLRLYVATGGGKHGK